jgi:RNA polymerase sigma-70 factor (ECF subfamily)
MDDADLVRQVLQGNRGAYGDLVNRYTGQVAALCRSRICRPQDVEDLVQETFFRGLDCLGSLHTPESFGSWLYAIARHLCSDWLSDPENVHAPLDGVECLLVSAAPAEEDERRDRTADLKRCVRQLPVELREVVEIYYSGGRITYQEMADRLGISFGQVNKLLTKARKMLRVMLEQEGGER